MRRWFVFDARLCVGCNTCNAACVLENGFQPSTRQVLAWNSPAIPALPVVSLSIACNHCSDPACLEGCPAKAYDFGPSGEIVHHSERCMGCRYCTWMCPYDAPKLNRKKGFIEKCHMCHHRAAEGTEPACITACPTGALKTFAGDLSAGEMPSWFPDKGLGPSVLLKGVENISGPEIIPADAAEDTADCLTERLTVNNGEWSLVIFSLLITGVAGLMMAFAGGRPPWLDNSLPVAMIVAMTASFMHLGVPVKAWRSMLNPFSSPLTREIGMTVILFAVSLMNIMLPAFLPAGAIWAICLLTLASVDMVYLAAGNTKQLLMHSGMTFISGIYLASWFSESATLFIIMTLVSAVSVVMRTRTGVEEGALKWLVYFRALALPAAFLLPRNPDSSGGIAAIVLVAAGIAADRILFYHDFKPINIKDTINTDFNSAYEKERD